MPAALLCGTLPTTALLMKHALPQLYIDVVESLRQGDLPRYERTLAEPSNADWLLRRGIWMVMQALRVVVQARFFRHVKKINEEVRRRPTLPTNRQIRLQVAVASDCCCVCVALPTQMYGDRHLRLKLVEDLLIRLSDQGAPDPAAGGGMPTLDRTQTPRRGGLGLSGLGMADSVEQMAMRLIDRKYVSGFLKVDEANGGERVLMIVKFNTDRIKKPPLP